MPVFGDKGSLAIEIAEAGKEDIYFFQLWLTGIQLGDFATPIYIKDSLAWTQKFMGFDILRYIENSHLLSKEVLFEKLYDCGMSYYRNGKWIKLTEKSECSCELAYHAKREIFHMEHIGGEALIDQAGIVLLHEPQITRRGKQRVIWRDFADLSLHEAIIRKGAFEEAAAAYLAYF